MEFEINGEDFSGYLYRYGLAIQYEKVYGNGGGKMRDGTETVDLLRVRTVLTAACNPLTSEQLTKISDACKGDYVLAGFLSPDGTKQWLMMIPELSTVNKSLTVSGVTYWEGLVITLREK